MGSSHQNKEIIDNISSNNEENTSNSNQQTQVGSADIESSDSIPKIRMSPVKQVDINSPMLGLNVNFSAAKSLAQTVDIMHSEKGVKLLNFAYIKLNNSQLLGEGSFSRVYRGSYKRRECAIKLVFSSDLTVDEIQRVAAESQMLSSIKVSYNCFIFSILICIKFIYLIYSCIYI